MHKIVDFMDTNEREVYGKRPIPGIPEIVAPGIKVVKKLWLPFVLIQFVGLVVVILYFSWPMFQGWCDAVGRVKASTGVFFAMLVLPIAGGVVPELFKHVTGVDRVWDRKRLNHLLMAMFAFCLSGLFVDTFYMFLARAFGDSSTFGVVAAKVAIDQAIYSPLVGVTWLAFCFTFERVGYSITRLRAVLKDSWYRREVAPMLVVCWAYWLPMTSLMYSLPTSLTFVFGAIASSASAILMVAVARRHD